MQKRTPKSALSRDPNVCFRTAGKRLDVRILTQFIQIVNKRYIDLFYFLEKYSFINCASILSRSSADNLTPYNG